MYLLVIVDDEIEQLEGLRDYYPWGKVGFEVTGSFSSIKMALDYLKKNHVDVVLTDILFPSGTGFDIIKEFQDKKDKPLFCILSAYDNFAFAQKAIQYGVQDFLVKPASFQDISKVFSRLYSILQEKDVKTEINEPSTGNSTIDKALSIMTKRIKTCTLHTVAQELGLSDAYLSRLFKEKKGENFQDVLLSMKMKAAQDMLLQKSNYHNKDLAEALGYRETQNFCRMFKKHFGMSPQEFRKQNENK